MAMFHGRQATFVGLQLQQVALCARVPHVLELFGGCTVGQYWSVSNP